jgi:hypothetical protein
VASGRFACSPPSEVVRIEVEAGEQARLERAGELRLTVRVTVEGAARSVTVLVEAR